MEGSGIRFRGAIAGGEERSQAARGGEQKYLYYIALVLMLYSICYIAYAT